MYSPKEALACWIVTAKCISPHLSVQLTLPGSFAPRFLAKLIALSLLLLWSKKHLAVKVSPLWYLQTDNPGAPTAQCYKRRKEQRRKPPTPRPSKPRSWDTSQVHPCSICWPRGWLCIWYLWYWHSIPREQQRTLKVLIGRKINTSQLKNLYLKKTYLADF